MRGQWWGGEAPGGPYKRVERNGNGRQHKDLLEERCAQEGEGVAVRSSGSKGKMRHDEGGPWCQACMTTSATSVGTAP